MTKNHTTAQRKSERELVVTRTFNAPAHIVFDAWTSPQHLAQWWGPRGFSVTTKELDVTAGGGAVKIKINGSGKFLALTLDPEFTGDQVVVP